MSSLNREGLSSLYFARPQLLRPSRGAAGKFFWHGALRAVSLDERSICTRRGTFPAKSRRLACADFERWQTALGKMKTLTAVLFVGGESRRMGRDKATLEINGEPLWLRQLKTLRELQPQKILISARTKPVWCPPEIEVVLDEPPSRGPLSGLAAVIQRIQTTHLLALAVDLPQMPVAHLEKLWSMADAGVAVVPRNAEHFEPLCAIYPVEIREAVQKAAADINASLHNFIRHVAGERQVRFHSISKSERAFYRNTNTMEDFIQAADDWDGS